MGMGGKVALPIIVSILILGGLGFSQEADAVSVFQFEFGSGGAAPGQFDSPSGVTTDSNDRIIVADVSNRRIQVFDSTGAFQFEFGSVGAGPGQFSFRLISFTTSTSNNTPTPT